MRLPFRTSLTSPLLAFLGLGLGTALLAYGPTGCTTLDPDQYAAAAAACDYIPTDYWSPTGTLTPECRAALEPLIPFDEESFAQAPPGFRDKIIETFQAMIAFKLKAPPSSKIFGVSPAQAGAIPLALWDILHEYPTANQSLFSFVINSMDAIVFMPPDGTVQQHSAYYTYQGTRRVIRVYSGFWNAADTGSFRWYPFRRMITLSHEARHGDGVMHEYCPSGSRKGEIECDPGFNGPRGMEIVVSLFLMHGGSLSHDEIAGLGQNICGIVQNTILHPFKELQDLVGAPFDCGSIDYDWVAAHEGLTDAPAAAPSPSPAGDPVR